jgi:dephospho-CoA kinase
LTTFVVGLTGGIGGGKSTVADLFAALGAAIVDTDDIAHQLTTGSNARAIPAIQHAFGAGVIAPDGSLDRAAMRDRAFADTQSKALLESILHPMIRQEVASQLQSANARTAPYVLLVVPLLFESLSYRDQVRETLLIDCPVTLQIARVQQRSSLAVPQIERIIAAQIPRAIRLQLADRVVFNVETVDSLRSPVAGLHAHYLRRAANERRPA